MGEQEILSNAGTLEVNHIEHDWQDQQINIFFESGYVLVFAYTEILKVYATTIEDFPNFPE